MHFPQSGFAHLLLGVALPGSGVEHSALLKLLTRVLQTIASDNLQEVNSVYKGARRLDWELVKTFYHRALHRI
jgi:hypothetical protein